MIISAMSSGVRGCFSCCARGAAASVRGCGAFAGVAPTTGAASTAGAGAGGFGAAALGNPATCLAKSRRLHSEADGLSSAVISLHLRQAFDVADPSAQAHPAAGMASRIEAVLEGGLSVGTQLKAKASKLEQSSIKPAAVIARNPSATKSLLRMVHLPIAMLDQID
ncbi:hypothetical protein [uncultured Bradyrhizobium sp.]|uniref:hypothetical protein n=1 Tax=uncultured Bradyrhizobium sp. TaxID=199684 RepID=UPI0035CA80E6